MQDEADEAERDKAGGEERRGEERRRTVHLVTYHPCTRMFVVLSCAPGTGTCACEELLTTTSWWEEDRCGKDLLYLCLYLHGIKLFYQSGVCALHKYLHSRNGRKEGIVYCSTLDTHRI